MNEWTFLHWANAKYVAGNFLFMKDNHLQGSHLSTCDITEYQQVERKLDILASAGLDEGLAAHTLNNYQSAALRNSLYKRNNFPQGMVEVGLHSFKPKVH